MPFKKILALRPDRMGDAILTLPAVSAIKEKYPCAEISFLADERIAPLFKNHPHISEVIPWRREEGVCSLRKRIKASGFDAAVHFFIKRETVLAAAFGAVPLTVGPFSKIWALLLDKKVKQHRRKSIKHEADYNLDLAGELGAPVSPRPAMLGLLPEEKEEARKKLSRSSIKPDAPFFLIHPGGARRGVPLPPEKFLEISRALGNQGKEVIVSIGPEEPELAEFFSEFPVRRGGGIREFASLISLAACFISNSTGPLHLACALSTPTVSFFGREKGVSPVRWGPYPPSSRNRVFFADEFSVDEVLSAVARAGTTG